ncbi:MAG: hypothetical protein IPJ19_05940 [Planctomycetes bacterium]|nr:hypothetical protein [Planctomycetota bacterium]
MNPFLRSLGVCAALCLCSALASAQFPGPDSNDTSKLPERTRPAMHPGEPLTISGLEEKGNELRARTPGLARGEHEPLQVDPDASYRRALAMYGDGAQFHSPLPLPGAQAAPEPVLAPEPAPAPVASEPAQPAVQQPDPDAKRWSVFAGLLVSALLIVWFFVRVRPALIAPKELPSAAVASEPFVWRPQRRPSKPKFQGPILEQPKPPLPQRPAWKQPPATTNGARMAPPHKRA